jgi:hypothetical protein
MYFPNQTNLATYFIATCYLSLLKEKMDISTNFAEFQVVEAGGIQKVLRAYLNLSQQQCRNMSLLS